MRISDPSVAKTAMRRLAEVSSRRSLATIQRPSGDGRTECTSLAGYSATSTMSLPSGLLVWRRIVVPRPAPTKNARRVPSGRKAAGPPWMSDSRVTAPVEGSIVPTSAPPFLAAL